MFKRELNNNQKIIKMSKWTSCQQQHIELISTPTDESLHMAVIRECKLLSINLWLLFTFSWSELYHKLTSKTLDHGRFLLNAWMNMDFSLKLSIKFKQLSSAIWYPVTLPFLSLLKENRHFTFILKNDCKHLWIVFFYL